MGNDRARSFGSVADLYDRYRPAPPPSLGEVIGSLKGRDVLEIAGGTGLCTRFLTSLGARLTVIEPDDDMRAVLSARSPGVRVLGARAEALPFPDASFDVVVTSSAWHWFRQPDTTDEAARVLRHHGDLWVLGNGFSRKDEWVVNLLALRELDEAQPGGQRAHELTFEGDDRFVDEWRVDVPWVWRRDVESLVQLFHTYSGVISRTDDERRALDDVVRARILSIEPTGVLDMPMAMRGVRVRRVR